MDYLRLFIVLKLILIGVLEATNVKWLILDLHAFHVNKSCLTDICRNPQFRNTLKVGSNHVSSSIQIDTGARSGIFDRIVSAPINPTHVSNYELFTEVMGTDPTFNFVRTCDNSSIEPISKFINRTIHEKESFELMLRGKCFHAKIMVNVYTNTCPWCVIDQSSVSSVEEQNLPLISSSTLLIIGLTVSLLVALISIIAFICACRLNRELVTKLRRLDTSGSPSTQDTESHYDLPWKNYACRNTRLVSVPYTPTKPIENLVCVSPSEQSSIEQSPFGVCLGTTHLYGSGRDNERYVAIRTACEDSGRDSI